MPARTSTSFLFASHLTLAIPSLFLPSITRSLNILSILYPHLLFSSLPPSPLFYPTFLLVGKLTVSTSDGFATDAMEDVLVVPAAQADSSTSESEDDARSEAQPSDESLIKKTTVVLHGTPQAPGQLVVNGYHLEVQSFLKG